MGGRGAAGKVAGARGREGGEGTGIEVMKQGEVEEGKGDHERRRGQSKESG